MMEIIGSIFENVFRPLKDFFSRTYGYVASSHYYIDALKNEMNELKSKRNDIRRMIAAAERRGLEAISQVNWWLDSVDKLEVEVESIKDEYDTRLQLPVDKAVGIRFTYLLSKKADATRELVDNLKERIFEKVADELVQVRFEEIPTVPVVGMGPILEQLKASLEDNDSGIIGIFGMAGVGKTALLKEFNNEYLLREEGINVAIYIEVTRDYDLTKIQEIIGVRLGLSWENKGPIERAVILYKVLSKMNFVIILDDIWEPIKLQMLGIPVPKLQSKSKIFLSTAWVSRSSKDKADEEEVLIVEGIKLEHDKFIKFDMYINATVDDDITPNASEFAGSFVHVPHKHNHGKKEMKLETVLKLGITDLLEDIGAEDDPTIFVTLVPRSKDKVSIGGIRIAFSK